MQNNLFIIMKKIIFTAFICIISNTAFSQNPPLPPNVHGGHSQIESPYAYNNNTKTFDTANHVAPVGTATFLLLSLAALFTVIKIKLNKKKI
jgi:hypothetical protein